MDEQLKLTLEYLNRELEAAETRNYDLISTTFNWLMATLFAANGGATIALVSNPTRLPGGLYALAWFAAGTILSLLMGTLMAFMGHRMMVPITSTKTSVVQSLVGGDPDIAMRALVDLKVTNMVTWKIWFSSYSGLGSLACFIIGVLTVAGSIIRSH